MLYHSKWDDNLKNELHIRANKSRNSLDSNIIMKQFPEIIDEVRNRVIFFIDFDTTELLFVGQLWPHHTDVLNHHQTLSMAV